MSARAPGLRERLQERRVLLLPGVFDALTGLLAERAGFEAVYVSGASVAYTRLGRPDIGLVTASELADTVACIRERISLPIVVDADTGFGNALNVRRTVRALERAGAGCIQLEDQTLPKRCGHLEGKTLVSRAEMCGKIRAALEARTSDETLIMARTDAIAVEGFDAALARAEAYLEAGAQVLFIEAPASLDQMRALCGRFAARAPLLANMVEGGRTPVLDAAALADLGYRIALFPGALVRALSRCAQTFFASLREHGSSTPFLAQMNDFSTLNTLLGTAEMLELGRRYASPDDAQGAGP
jgi:2-methylisocitrate lyase-like PEP mutase family enzyme